MAKLQWKRGTEQALASYSAEAHERDIAIDSENFRINLFDGAGGKVELPLLTDISSSLSELENDVEAWSKAELTKVSQLTNDSNFWSSSTLTKVSQLTNDSGFKTAYCTHCTYCTYCQQCANCHNCTTVNCTTVNCTTVKCSVYSWCYQCQDCDCYCSDS